jgi:molybdopterin-guanine dinucleotide biosynthesis protein A
MGQDKALLPFLGQPLIVRVMARLAPIADEIVVTTNRPDDYQFLSVRLAPDPIPGRGALGGLYTALVAASHPIVAVVACDMPFINPGLVKAEHDLMVANQVDIVIPHTQEGLEPFHAVYRRQVCLPHVEAALEEQKWRVDAWFHKVKMYRLTVEELSKYDPQLRSFWNVNTPEELETAIQIAAQENAENPNS